MSLHLRFPPPLIVRDVTRDVTKIKNRTKHSCWFLVGSQFTQFQCLAVILYSNKCQNLFAMVWLSGLSLSSLCLMRSFLVSKYWPHLHLTPVPCFPRMWSSRPPWVLHFFGQDGHCKGTVSTPHVCTCLSKE